MKLFRADLVVYATAYVHAENFKDAALKLSKLRDKVLEVQSVDSRQSLNEVPISGRRADDPALPEVSISPAMTIAHLASDITEVER